MTNDLSNIPQIMGILNVTPDSFYEQSRLSTLANNNLTFNAADILDVGFESSRPGSKPVSENKELERLSIFLTKYQNIHHNLSIDTYKPQVARLAIENGFSFINDITAGGEYGEMFEIAILHNVKMAIMHMKGTPENMQKSPIYNNLIDELLSFFDIKLKFAKKIGLNDSQIIIDPGIGFGKSYKDNYIIINNIKRFKEFGYPVMLGVSRKSFLSINDDKPIDRLTASLVSTVVACQNGVDIIRTHDVDEMKKMLTTISRINIYKS